MAWQNVTGYAVTNSRRCVPDAKGDPIKNAKGQNRYLVTWKDEKGTVHYNQWFLKSISEAKMLVEDPKSGLGGMLISVELDKV